jgi:hypothetical protein
MELAWRLGKKVVVSKSRDEGETDVIKGSPHSTKSSSSEFDWVWEDTLKEMEIPTTAIRPQNLTSLNTT